ncbi:hypothetical protein EYF80_022124 [Liparis tanakae]|uniref:Uncharacterized protein n=1 Tax=Liparis tanakae TaxID=230148 RepID=A0A4Z2HPX7_9TELE|nr:hypothetical protein EYF80_022124 [Liparis tanakae]
MVVISASFPMVKELVTVCPGVLEVTTKSLPFCWISVMGLMSLAILMTCSGSSGKQSVCWRLRQLCEARHKVEDTLTVTSTVSEPYLLRTKMLYFPEFATLTLLMVMVLTVGSFVMTNWFWLATSLSLRSHVISGAGSPSMKHVRHKDWREEKIRRATTMPLGLQPHSTMTMSIQTFSILLPGFVLASGPIFFSLHDSKRTHSSVRLLYIETYRLLSKHDMDVILSNVRGKRLKELHVCLLYFLVGIGWEETHTG